MSVQDLPTELRNFGKVFDKLSYRNEMSSVFDDFLQFIISGFSKAIKWEPRNYDKKDLPLFNELFSEWVLLMQKMTAADDKAWYDAFGSFYELKIASRGRRENSGQFFTPEAVVDLMTAIQGTPEELTGKGLRVNDPACGSGRGLISFHAAAPGNYMFGEDIDKTCAMMTVCNMLIHGAVGEVVWHDSLNPESFYGGWMINETLCFTGIPGIEPLEKDNALVIKMWRSRMQEVSVERKEVKIPELPEKQNNQGTAFQMKLF